MSVKLQIFYNTFIVSTGYLIQIIPDNPNPKQWDMPLFRETSSSPVITSCTSPPGGAEVHGVQRLAVRQVLHTARQGEVDQGPSSVHAGRTTQWRL